MPTNVYYKNRILVKYSSLIAEFFQLMNHSDTLKTVPNAKSSLYIGINAIHRVFEFILLKTKNVENAYFYSQKSYYYYLEYMEQIHKSEFALNHMDAILFVYKKTIYEIQDGTTNNTSDTATNVMTLNNETITIEEDELKLLLTNAFNFAKTLFFWENDSITFDNRLHLCDEYLHRYLLKVDSLELIGSYLELIQEKINMEYKKYEELLQEIIEKLEKTKRSAVFKNIDKNDRIFNKFYMNQDTLYEKFHGETTKDLVKWLFV